jgi:multidrug transporter EmrE-like cation transporter
LSVYLAALLAGVAWMVALTMFELSPAYPLMSATFALVLVLSALFFGEPCRSRRSAAWR